MKYRWIARTAGPLLFILIAAAPAPPGLSDPGKYTAAIVAWMAVWWITEAVHTAVTALLPLVLFPLCGVLRVEEVSAEFGNEIIFLFLAGFLFGRAIERWNLHTRIALQMALWLGHSPSRMVLGFMLATGFVSMWISNTATAVMMTPVAVAVGGGAWASSCEGHNFRKALLLGVAYACSIGGMATIVGTPTNAIMLGHVQRELHQEISFGQWFVFAFPFAVVLLLLCWFLLIRLFPPGAAKPDADYRQMLRPDLEALGPLSMPERRLSWLFGCVIIGWLTGSLLWYSRVPNCNDVVVAVAGAILLFFVPAGNADGRTPLLDWENALRIPWGVLLFFGGGLAMAKGFKTSGLAQWAGSQMEGLRDFPPLLILLAVLLVVTVLSEIASNIATASMMMQVLPPLAAAVGMDTLGILLSAALAASFGFGLPIATAPNTIVFSSGYLSTRDMARAGFLLDIMAVLLLTGFLYFWLPLVWGVQIK